MTEEDKTEFEEDMIVCPHCSERIKFDIELCDGRSVEIKHIAKATWEEFNLDNKGR